MPSAIDTRDETRATSRKECYDPVYLKRPNLHLLTGQTVSEVLFQDLSATGVRMISRADNRTVEVYARKEVVHNAGAVQTPQLLQVNGIDLKDVLNAARIKVKKDMLAVARIPSRVTRPITPWSGRSTGPIALDLLPRAAAACLPRSRYLNSYLSPAPSPPSSSRKSQVNTSQASTAPPRSSEASKPSTRSSLSGSLRAARLSLSSLSSATALPSPCYRRPSPAAPPPSTLPTPRGAHRPVQHAHEPS